MNMKPRDFFRRMSLIDQSSIITLKPRPLFLRVNQHDAMAAKLLLWLQDQLPDDATPADVIHVLDAAHWWATFWTSLVPQPTEPQEPPQ